MKKIGTKGFRISSQDRKALDHYLAVTPDQWAFDALRGMINKAVKTIINDYLPKYMEQNPGTISADPESLIPILVGMEEFKPYRYDLPETDKEKARRKGAKSDEIWPNGFDIQDYEDIALHAFYVDPERYLEDLMENKIAKRKNAFHKEHVKKYLADPEISSIPSDKDDMIDFATAKPEYKNRVQRDAETFGV